MTTSIWSSPPTANSSASPSHASAQHEDEESVDPLSPVLGSRAYRERERREMDRGKREMRELKKKEKVAMTKIVGHEGESPVENSVLVKTRLERWEEEVGTAS